MKSIILSFVIFVCAVILMVSIPANAKEIRTYIRVDTTVYRMDNSPITLNLTTFIKSEDRFGEQGLLLNKMFVGIKLRLMPWLSTQLYYAHKDSFYSLHKQKHMAVGDLILSYDIESFCFLNRVGNEWHVSDKFYRLRNYTELLYKTSLDFFGVWMSEEFRMDSDQERINMNDFRVGVRLLPLKNFRLKIFYDFESSHRNKTDWIMQQFVGIDISTHL